MRKISILFVAFLMTITTIQPAQAVDVKVDNKTMNDQEIHKMKQLKNYNVFLNGNHSANQADLEGALAVRKDSSFTDETSEFSYGAIFNSDSNTVGQDPTDDELISLLIGGSVVREGGKDYQITIDYRKDNGVLKGRFVGNKKSIEKSKESFKENLRTEQTYQYDDMDAVFDSLQNQGNSIQSKLNRYTNSAINIQEKTLGETWLDGKLVQYEIFQSAVDESVLIINILPQNEDGKLETIVHSFGIPEKLVKEDTKIIVTSFDRNEQGDRVHAEKVAFKGNFLVNTESGINVADQAGREKMAPKVLYYLPQATQVTNFFDHVDYRTFKNPSGIFDDRGVENNKFKYYKDYLKDYATGNNNNGSAEHGGGSEIIGSVFAPQASIILTGSSINGFINAKNLHQRNAAEIHNFKPNWLFEEKEAVKGSVVINKKGVDSSESESISLTGAEFLLYKQAQGGKLYYEKINDTINWVSYSEVKHPDLLLKETSQGNGKYSADNLEPGTYFIQEVKAPDGYEIDNEPKRVVIKADESDTIELDFLNQKEKEKLYDLKINKTDTKGNALEGAEFILSKKEEGKTLYYAQYENFETWVPNVIFAKKLISNSNGEIIIKNLKQGQYELLETKAPKGHVIEKDKEITPITIPANPEQAEKVNSVAQETEAENELIVVTIENKPVTPETQEGPKGTVSIRKIDPQNNELKGAEFILIAKAGDGKKVITDYVDEKPTSWDDYNPENIKNAHKFESVEDGKIEIKNLNLGEYELREVKAPDGFELRENNIEFELYQELSEQTIKYHFDVINRRVDSGLKIEKVDASNAENKLFGAEFILKNSEGLFYTNNIQQLFSSNKDEAYVAKTGIDGIAKFEHVPLGKYKLSEIKAPAGFEKLEADIEVEINKTSELSSIEVENKSIEDEFGRLDIQKRDKDQIKTKLEGAGFILKLKSPEQYFTGIPNNLWSTNSKDAREVFTDKKGQASFNQLPYGVYELIEKTYPKGYGETVEPIEITIDENSNTTLNLIDVYNKKVPLTPIEKFGSLAIIKTDKEDDNLRLEGAEFILKQGEQFFTGIADEPFSDLEEKALKVTTDENGKANFENLPLGEYQLFEVKAPEGYDELKNAITVKINDEVTVRQEVKNTKTEVPVVLGKLEIIKTDSQDDNLRLEGAEFILKQGEQFFTGIADEPFSDLKKEALKVTTDENGKASFENLPLGEYELIEVKAPEGYDILEKAITVKINDEVAVRQEVKNTKTEVPVVLGKLEIIKTDSQDDNLRLEGAEFILKQGEQFFTGKMDEPFSDLEEKALKVTTDENGKANFENIPLGEYKLIETSAPNGYEELVEVIAVTISDAKLVTEQVKNTKIEEEHAFGKLMLTKVDAQNSEKLLEGAAFVIVQADQYLTGDMKNPLTSDFSKALKLVSDEQGRAILNEIPFGSYELMEVKAPVGYDLLDKTIPFEISEENESFTTELFISNKQSEEKPQTEKLGNLRILKVDQDNHKLGLKNAEFVLIHGSQYYAGPNRDFTFDINEAFVIKTDRNGVALIDDLPYGIYQLKEIKAPKNYELKSEFIKVSIENESNEVTVENTKHTQATIPGTGQGNEFIIAAAVLVVAGVIILLFKKRQ